MLLPVTMSCAKEREYVCVVWSCTDDGGHGTFFCRCLQGMNEAYDTRGCYASQFLPECQFVYALSPFVLVMWLDLQQTGWMMMIMSSRQQLRSASMGMTLIEVTQALYPATAAADWCVLYSLLPYFFLLRSSTNMATRPSPQQAPQTYQFKLVLLGKYNRMVASRHLFFFFFLAKVPDSWLFL